MVKYFIVTLLLVTLSAQAQKLPKAVLANDKAIAFAGRIDFSNPLKVKFCQSGVSIKTILLGTAIGMTLEDYAVGDEQHTNYFNVIIDDSSYVLEAKAGKQHYILASNLTAGKHTVEVFKRTECFVGSSAFLGFFIAENSSLELPEKKKLTIEFIGNSLTCGYGNEVSIEAPPAGNPNVGFHSKNENNYLAYGAITARKLNAEYRCVAYSGRGMYRNNTGTETGTTPKIYDKIFPDEATSLRWDFTKDIVDVLVINVGTNDFNPESRGDFVNEEIFIKTYCAFLDDLRSKYPNAKIVCVVGNAMSDYWPEGRNCWTRIQTYVQAIVNTQIKKGDSAVYYFKLDPQSPPYGEDWHPTVATHFKMAEALTPFIKEITGL
jgi:lysophospholipase L1-like esterase